MLLVVLPVVVHDPLSLLEVRHVLVISLVLGLELLARDGRLVVLGNLDKLLAVELLRLLFIERSGFHLHHVLAEETENFADTARNARANIGTLADNATDFQGSFTVLTRQDFAERISNSAGDLTA